MQTRNRSRLTILSLAILCASAGTGCELLVNFDRTKIGTDAGADAGVPVDAGDAGPTDDGGGDAGPDCGGDARLGTACAPASSPCEAGVFACIGGAVECTGTGGPVAAGLECRASAGPCDVAEVCDGASMACPATDAFAAAGVECRASVGECDAAETCNGTSADCGADEFEPVGTVCATGFCNAAGACDATCSPGVACSTGNPCALGTVDCSGATPVCTASGPAPAGTACRAVAGACDVAEVCTGTTMACPADARAAATVECRASSDDCDLAERCDGVAVTCPADGLAAAGALCRTAAAGGCDVAESCTGSGAACPADDFLSASTQCRAASGMCDVAELCTGASATCPANGFAAMGTSCTPPTAGECNGSGVCGCVAPLSVCTAACVDTRSDELHCGMCTTVCGGTEDCISSNCVGVGNLAFAATWSRAGDGDLLVNTPGGNTVWKSNLGPNAGTDMGEMDRVEVTGTGPENVFWATANVPASGTYDFCVETNSFSPAPAAGTPVTATVVVRRPAMADVTMMRTFMAPTSGAVTCNNTLDSYIGSVTIP